MGYENLNYLLSMLDIDLLYSDDFLENIKKIQLSKKDINAIYTYLSMMEGDLSDNEIVFWSEIIDNAEIKNDDKDSNTSEL